MKIKTKTVLNFFRRIRRKLSNEGRLKTYLFYAIGEIFLIVVGILIALQLNNWNQNSIQKKQFLVLLEQIYNAIYLDAEQHYSFLEGLNTQIELIDQVLKKPDSIPTKKLLPILFYLDINPPYNTITRAKNLAASLDYNDGGVQQKEITKEILTYSANSTFDLSLQPPSYDVLTPLLLKEKIPRPSGAFLLPEYQGFRSASFFDEDDVRKANAMVSTKEFRSALKTLRSLKEGMVRATNEDRQDGLSVLQLIQNYHPKVRLIFDNIGIIGSALETGWERSIPMICTNRKKSIWELEIYLQKGDVKFRNRDSWNQNWGGESFPTGRPVFFGRNISVVEGNYQIQLDLSNNTYKFNKVEK